MAVAPRLEISKEFLDNLLDSSIQEKTKLKGQQIIIE